MTTPAEMDTDVAANLVDTPIPEYLSTDHLAYMLYTIEERAIPAANDGLKPGQRRMLYSMYVDRVLPDRKPVKSARLVNSATARYHPHGGAAMYGAMVNLAVPFRRVRLVDGIGSFGQSPGDVPASDRYTEARLSEAGYALVRELADKAVPMTPNYDNSDIEPKWLPVQFPALLVGGAHGMAEAYASKVPAHNPREVMALCKALLADPDLPTDEMLRIMPGPDWGTGAAVIGDQSGIRDYYETGRGQMTVRGTYEVGKRAVTITELPPGEGLDTLRSLIRAKVKDGIIEGVADVTDLTDLERGMCLEVSVKRGHKAEDVAEALLRETKLEVTFAASLVALDEDRLPRWWSVRELVQQFLGLRDAAVIRRSEVRLAKVEDELLAARALAAVALDKERASRMILDAEDRSAATAAIAAGFDLTEEQGAGIVALPLYRLTKADALAAQQKVADLEAEAKRLNKLITSPAARKKVIAAELDTTAEMFEDAEYDRRTRLEPGVAPAGRAGEGEDGPALGRWKFDAEAGVLGDEGVDLADDSLLWAVFTDGRIKMFAGGGLPRRIATTTLAPDISELRACGVLADGEHLVLVTRAGKVLRVDPAKINPQGIAGNGVAGIKLDPDHDGGDTVVFAGPITDDRSLLTISEQAHKVTPGDDIPVKGRGGKGVGVHLLRGSDGGLVEAATGPGFEVNGKKAAPTPRSKATVKKPVTEWQVAE